mmetsp:Transcript_415/g.1093  ORF Transcript_415/g.1093 Transcript_415/m.1093 type:complete len:188 (-) Transcript_415:834-1397(-)
MLVPAGTSTTTAIPSARSACTPRPITVDQRAIHRSLATAWMGCPSLGVTSLGPPRASLSRWTTAAATSMLASAICTSRTARTTTTPSYRRCTCPSTQTLWMPRVHTRGYSQGPFMCWKGNISSIPNFWTSASPPQKAAKDWKGYQASTVVEGGDLSEREDYEQVRPCEGMTEYYAESGYHLPGAGEP